MATKIDGTAIARSIREGLKDEILQIQQTNPRFKPSLVIFQGMTASVPSQFQFPMRYTDLLYSWRPIGFK